MFCGRYRILSLLGRGGMGHVYRAEHLGLGKDVALKVMTQAAPDFAVRFEREARAIARLDHPGCVRVLDYGEDDAGLPFIAMDLLDGPTLAAAITDTQFSVARALHVTRSLLSALAHAHRNGIVHRDVKPENVMFAVRGGVRAVLIDFGLASLRDAPALTGNGMCLGSPSYIAPERLLGRPHDARADLYAVGVILYEMLAGVRPFVGASPRDIMQQAMSRPPRPLRALRADIPDVLDAIVRRALAKDPDRRFSDAEEMLSALADISVTDDLDAYVARTEREEQETTVAELSIFRPSLWFRMWSWLRYGAWRWRPSH